MASLPQAVAEHLAAVRWVACFRGPVRGAELSPTIGAAKAWHASSPAKFMPILLGAVLPLGCAHLGKGPPADSMPHGTVCQVVTTWNHQVVHAPDPVHGGAPTPGLIGRLYLFGQEISYPLVEEGSVVVDLYDDTKPNTGETRPPLEEWRLDRENLKRLLKRDTIGWGYTLFLPWGTFKPDVNLVHLKIRYEPSKGTPLYAESGPLTLDNAEVSQRAMLSRPSGGGAKEAFGLGRESMPPQGRQANPQGPGKTVTAN